MKSDELTGLVFDVVHTGQSRCLSDGSGRYVMVIPVDLPVIEPDLAERHFLESAGAWQTLDAEAMKARIRDRRRAASSAARR